MVKDRNREILMTRDFPILVDNTEIPEITGAGPTQTIESKEAMRI